MTIEQLTELFKWMSLINIGLLILTTLLIIPLRKLLYAVHGKLFDLSKEQMSPIIYSYLGAYKLLIIVFNIVPYIALLLLQ